MFSLPVSGDGIVKIKAQSFGGTISNVYSAYIQENDHETLNKTNTVLLENAVQAVEKVAPALKTFILQTGGKA